MDVTPELLKNVGSGGFGLVCLGTLIWVVKFTLTRMESALRENTDAVKSLLGYFKSHNMYVSGNEARDGGE